ncbi:sensor domain-containing diguanylate cyclase [Psychromonas sp. psych-6C06]|uniref:diguanylate cyclase n=1 Tax=Psychromonas sp. psych-6C06 TaxID=2058089 RepID=UPI000C32892D|nr:diguanylate cyclase [Psychromonas sp. psych-6C06]PKF63792.1 sensor domain-containing diguanylate cyclase [Psychromonas sp. psych-6C06]
MLILDTRTLLLVTSLISIGSAIALVAVWRAQTRQNGAGFWAIGMSFVAIASLFISARGTLSDIITLVLANTLYVLGFILIARGVRIFCGHKPLIRLDIFLPLASMVGFYYYNYIEQDLNARVVIISFAFVIVSTNVIYALLRDKTAPWRNAGFATGLVFVVFGLAHAIRGGNALFYANQQPFMDPSLASTLVFLSSIFVIGGTSITLILLTYAALESELRNISLAVNQSASSVVITNTAGNIEYVNPAFSEKTGYQENEVIGKNPRILRSKETEQEQYEELWQQLSEGKTWRGEFHNRKKNGDLFWEIASIAPVKQRNGTISHYVAVKEDITELKDAKARITYLANHDALTGLPTRRLATDRLTKALAIAKRDKSKTAMMFVDLDGFKAVNDSLGHEAGDTVLQETAKRLCDTVREVDTVARVGGDEFWIILTNFKTKRCVEKVANKVLFALNEPYFIDDVEIEISASVGITLYPDHATTPENLVKLADKAMYDVKNKGKNGYSFSTAD